MELKYLYTVKKILETGSYQNAAQALNYAQSTITFQIKQLETELSIKLFEKKGTSMVLTQAGQDILPLIDKVLADAEALQNYKNQLSYKHWHLHIAMPETLATYKLQPLLKEFRHQAPEVLLSARFIPETLASLSQTTSYPIRRRYESRQCRNHSTQCHQWTRSSIFTSFCCCTGFRIRTPEGNSSR